MLFDSEPFFVVPQDVSEQYKKWLKYRRGLEMVVLFAFEKKDFEKVELFKQIACDEKFIEDQDYVNKLSLIYDILKNDSSKFNDNDFNELMNKIIAFKIPNIENFTKKELLLALNDIDDEVELESIGQLRTPIVRKRLYEHLKK